MDKKNTINIHTTLNGAELKISAPSTKQTISATNNRAQYFAEQAMRYRDEAKQHRDNAKLYAEQNSDVTFEYINNIKDSLEYKISTKQDTGNYALKEEIPINVSELVNDSNYVNSIQFSHTIEELSLPDRTDKVGCFLRTDGINESWVGINSFQLFDTKLSDHILDGEESLGWALQGTYVSKAIYPDFYTKCIEQKEAGVATETTLSGSTITLYNNSNGHKFYDIADKGVIDAFYNAMGTAWFYGVDTENERIFLPRNNYLTSYIEDGAKTVSVYGNGKTLGVTNGSKNGGLYYSAGSVNSIRINTSAYGTNIGTSYSSPSFDDKLTIGITRDASKSGITGSVNLQNSSNDLFVYICVGNTTVNEALVDVGQLSSDLLYKADKTEVDGQWVGTELFQIHDGAMSVGTLSFDLSDYLPNDGYCYEVIVNLNFKGGSTTTALHIGSGLISSIDMGQTADSSDFGRGNAIIPIGTDRVLKMILAGANAVDVNLLLVGYRRIGTNL